MAQTRIQVVKSKDVFEVLPHEIRAQIIENILDQQTIVHVTAIIPKDARPNPQSWQVVSRKKNSTKTVELTIELAASSKTIISDLGPSMQATLNDICDHRKTTLSELLIKERPKNLIYIENIQDIMRQFLLKRTVSFACPFDIEHIAIDSQIAEKSRQAMHMNSLAQIFEMFKDLKSVCLVPLYAMKKGKSMTSLIYAVPGTKYGATEDDAITYTLMGQPIDEIYRMHKIVLNMVNLCNDKLDVQVARFAAMFNI